MTKYHYKFFIFLFLGVGLISDFTQAQRTITGMVTSEDRESLPSATVVIKGTTQGTVTDLDGKYSIVVPEKYDVLVYSFVRLKSKEITIGNQSVIDVVLEESALSEVVVTGLAGRVAGVKIRGARTRKKSKSHNFSYSQPNTENYDSKEENSFKAVSKNPLSTFSINKNTESFLKKELAE